MPVDYFPTYILQNGIKLTTEPPRGIRANLKRIWNNFDEEQMKDCPKADLLFRFIWGLSYFHALVQERRKFGPIGWNIRYEFNDSDIETSISNVKILIEENDEVPWDSLLFISGHINYGGRVTDDWDRRCLIIMLKQFFNKQILEEKFRVSGQD